MTRIFEVEDNIVKVNDNVLLIPEFRAVVEKYTDPIPALSYIYFMSAPDSPYANLEEDERSEVVSDDVGGDFSLEDEEIEAALAKATKLMLTRTQRLHKAAGINLDKIAKYLEDQALEGGKDGNLGEVVRIQVGLPKIMENYQKLTKMANEELQTKLRGSAQTGMY